MEPEVVCAHARQFTSVFHLLLTDKCKVCLDQPEADVDPRSAHPASPPLISGR